ncbi:uncharacterized protein Dana_GF26738, isoform A [Drosophila ananassae]|uniref:Uncharacterized protein, isoform A n=1 Tax=Drosophila ananassae TaxID=7217 RepID=A0A0P8XWJ8_DROAN|nr:uncharacterized protein Dana_GF26738, isoform A [Drosophila ananassae]
MECRLFHARSFLSKPPRSADAQIVSLCKCKFYQRKSSASAVFIFLFINYQICNGDKGSLSLCLWVFLFLFRGFIKARPRGGLIKIYQAVHLKAPRERSWWRLPVQERLNLDRAFSEVEKKRNWKI